MKSPDLILIGCTKGKRRGDDRVAAAELYTSDLFRKRRAYAEASGREWRIFSAKHGIVHPRQLIPPYDVTIADLDDRERSQLAHGIARQLRGILDPVIRTGRRPIVELHAGADYAEILASPYLIMLELDLELPMKGKGIGRQLQAYATGRIDQ